LAKFLENVESPVKIDFFGYKAELTFELPFSWKMFFFGALAFTLASILFKVFAPTIIKENKSFADFLQAKKSFAHLFRYMSNLGINFKYIQRYNLGLADLKAPSFKVDPNLSKSIKKKIKMYQSLYFTSVVQKKDEYQQDFWIVHNYANEARFFWRIVVTILYAIGIFLIGWVLVEAVITVLNIGGKE